MFQYICRQKKILRFAKCDKGEAVNILDIKELTFAYPDNNDDSGERYLLDALKNVTLSVGQGNSWSYWEVRMWKDHTS